jgi:hypothetical protein
MIQNVLSVYHTVKEKALEEYQMEPVFTEEAPRSRKHRRYKKSF